MSRFSPSESALEGFKLVGKRPWTVLAWSIFFFAGIMLTFFVMLLTLGQEFVEFVKSGGLGSADVHDYSKILQKSLIAFPAVLLLWLVVWSTLTAAVYRLILRPHESGWAYLRFGGDELRLTIVNLILIVCGALAITFVRAVDAGVGGLLGFLVSFALTLALIWVSFRLFLATPMTFAERRIAIIPSWNLTHGHFWSLLGMTILTIIFWLIVWLICTVIGLAAVAAAGGQEMIDHPTSASPLAIITIGITLLIQLLLPALQVIMLASPLAEAYRELHDEPVPPL